MYGCPLIVVDSKCDYPAACNAVETVLVHKDLLNSQVFNTVICALKDRNVTIHPGPKLMTCLPFTTGKVASLQTEYGSLECNVEVVESVNNAIDHINSYGSSHTDAIITENSEQT